MKDASIHGGFVRFKKMYARRKKYLY